MDLIVDKEILRDIEKATQYEWMEKNSLGQYCASTVIGMNTRREHGLFVVPDAEARRRIVLLSKFEESVFVENRVHEISTSRYTSGVFPEGFVYLTQFSKNPFPTFLYDIEGRRLRKTLFLLSDSPTLVLRYELLDKGLPLKLVLKPFLADRYSTELTRATKGLNTDSYIGEHFVRWALKSDMPETTVFYNRGEFIAANLWYKNFEYIHDHNHFANSSESLFNPGFFQVELAPYESFDLYVSLNSVELPIDNYEHLYRGEVEKRREKKGLFFTDDPRLFRVEKSMESSILNIEGREVIPGSILENNFATRDMLFSLPGHFLIHEKFERFKTVYKELAGELSQGLLPVYLPGRQEKNHYCSADISLWFIQLGYLYFEMSNDLSLFDNELMDAYRSILDNYIKGTLYNIYMDKDKLIFAGNKSTSASWIPLKDETGDVLRYGKLLEVNALWYNALRVFSRIAQKAGRKRWASKYDKIADKAAESFKKVFLRQEGLADFINAERECFDKRVNRLVLLALPFSPLEREEEQTLFDQVVKEMITPYGCKSNAPGVQNGRGAIHRKNSLYFSGAIWPWTVSLLVEAARKYDWPGKSAGEWQTYFEPVLKLTQSGLLDHIPEAVTDEREARQSGMIDATMSLACVVWAYFRMEDNKTKRA